MERLWSGREGAQVTLGQGFVPKNSRLELSPSLIRGQAAGGWSCSLLQSHSCPKSLPEILGIRSVPVLPGNSSVFSNIGEPREGRRQGEKGESS